MKVSFRTYKRVDKNICCEMMRNTWMYERFFPNTKNPMNLYKFMLSNYLYESDYTEIAVSLDENNNETVLGFLFGQTKNISLGKKILHFLFMVKVSVLWLLGAYGNRTDILELLKKMKEDEEVMFADISADDAHMHLFFTEEQARGLGIGKQLLVHFEDYCKKNDISSIVLITDTDCNYGFYDHIGFERIKEQKGCFGVPQTEEQKQQTTTFIYVKNF